MHRKRTMPMLRLVEGEGGDGGGSAPKEKPAEGEQQEGQDKPQTFTQAEVDRIVADRVKRERSKFSDYNDLKAKASESKTLEDRLADMEKRVTSADAKALRSDIAAAHGISAEDRDLFLTGTDEDTLTAQAQRLAQREVDRKKKGNVAPNEGRSPEPKDDPNREFIRNMLGGDSG